MKTIFVSGTFRDMDLERDAIHEQVMPRINEVASVYPSAICAGASTLPIWSPMPAAEKYRMYVWMRSTVASRR